MDLIVIVMLIAQELLDVTRSLLVEMGAAAAAADAAAGAKSGEGAAREKPVPDLKLDAAQDELREKFGIVRVRRHGFTFCGLRSRLCAVTIIQLSHRHGLE